MIWHDYPDRDFLYLSLANTIAGQLADYLRRDGRATLSVPGGTTPGPVLDILSGVDLDWARVTVVPTDERWVPEDHPRANARLLRRHLLRGKAAAARLVPLFDPAAGTPEQALPALEQGIAPHLPISVLLLGMGTDMHVASLFPAADRLAQALSAHAPPVLALRAEAAGEPRVSLTAPVLKAAINIHILITGPEKRAAIERAASLPPEEAPVRVVLDQAEVHWAE